MKILLIHPFNPEESYHYVIPQVSFGYLSASLKNNGFSDVKIIDFQFLKAGIDRVQDILKEEKPDVIGIRFWSSHIAVVRSYIQLARKLFGGKVKIVIGGPHPSVAPREAASCIEGVDFGFTGEAEEGLPLLIKKITGRSSIDYKDIPGLIWLDDFNQWQVNSPVRPERLDKYPIDWPALNLPLYHQLDQKSPNFDRGKKRINNGFLFCSRGCPYRCTYCGASIISGSLVRYFPPRLIIDDIYKLYYQYGIRHFNIMDDNFTFSKDYVMEFCREYLKNPLPDATFSCPNGVRIDRLDEEMLMMMKKCGWVKLMIGIESGSPAILEKMGKKLDLKKIREGIKLINKQGIQSWGFFILGYPGETKKTLQETIDFALKSPLTWASFAIFSPIPGTEVFNELLAQGRIADAYEMKPFHLVDISFSKLSLVELRQAQRRAYFKFYLKPRKFFKTLLETRPGFLLKAGLSILR